MVLESGCGVGGKKVGKWEEWVWYVLVIPGIQTLDTLELWIAGGAHNVVRLPDSTFLDTTAWSLHNCSRQKPVTKVPHDTYNDLNDTMSRKMCNDTIKV